MIKFKTTKRDNALIKLIVKRAAILAKSASIDYPDRDISMDITATHLNGCRLRLEDLLAAQDPDFGHDVFGIRRHLDRDTGKLKDFFVPRFSRPTPALYP